MGSCKVKFVRSVLCGLCLIASLASPIGCRWAKPSDPALFTAGRASYCAGAYPSARADLGAYTAGSAATPRKAEALLFQGASALAVGDASQAISLLEQARTVAAPDSVHLQALATLARAYMQAGQTPQALAAQEALAQGGFPADEAQALRIEILEAGGFAAAANTARRKLLQLYPQSLFVAQSAGNVAYPYAVHLRDVFSTPTAAAGKQQRLQAAGFPQFLIHEPYARGAEYRIQIGAFPNRASAEQRIAQLRTQGFQAVLR